MSHIFGVAAFLSLLLPSTVSVSQAQTPVLQDMLSVVFAQDVPQPSSALVGQFGHCFVLNTSIVRLECYLSS